MKKQWKKYFMIGLMGIAVETLSGSHSLLAQEIAPTLVEETPVISVEDVAPLDTPTGNFEDLAEIEEKDGNQWTWGVGGEEQGTSEVPTAETPYQIDKKSQPDAAVADWEEDNKNWQSRNRGDFNASSSKFPFARF